MGFCLLNNLAIAAASALEEGLQRILIVDYDAHHGNGTQDIFAGEPRAAFVSTHQQHIYPGTGSLQDVPTARGRLVNLPFPAYTGDRGFLQAVDQVVAPLAQRFRPQMLFVSAGFDAHWTDPLTTLGLSTTGYYHLSCRLIELARDLCGGKTVFVLEGGYDPLRLADNVRAVMAAMAGASRAADSRFEDPAGPSRHPEPDITPLLHQARHLHQLD
jgi:acetoin utilization deacetylase AcuC-like enzyme